MSAATAVSQKPRVSIVKVTPNLAAQWLEKNTNNRNLIPAAVRDYARDIEDGRFHFTGEPIQFDGDGNLENGQHRLAAIVQTGRTVPLVVVRGVTRDAQKYMDSGRKRTAANALQMENTGANMAHVAAVARGLLIFLEGRRPTQSEVVEFAESNLPELIESATIARATQTAPGMCGGVALFGIPHFLLAQVDEVDARYFFEHLASGESLQKGSGIYALRQQIITGARTGGRMEDRLRTNIALFFKAWNAWRDAKPIARLGYSSVEAFPVPR